MAQYGGEQHMKKEGHPTDEHVQNQLHSTTAGQGCKEGKQGVVEKIKEKLPGGDQGTNKHTTHDTTTGQNIGGTGTNMGKGGGHGCKEGKQGGVVETIKEKLPGGDKGCDTGGTGTNVHSTKTGQNVGGTGTNMGKGGGHGCEEGKQGVVEKIKEKLPGGDHGADEHKTHATATVGGGEYGNVGEEGREKKGFGGNIKDKLPGGGNQ